MAASSRACGQRSTRCDPSEDLLALLHLLGLPRFLIISDMSSDLSPPVLLRRIAQLEAAVGRLHKDLGVLRLAVSQHGLQLPKGRGARSAGTGTPQLQADGGLAGAIARGEAARVQWLREGLIVPGEQLARAWGLTRQALAPAAERGEVFSIKLGNRLYYPVAFLSLEREAVAAICRALGDLGASEKLMFWLREHGALAGQRVGSALAAGTPLLKVERLAAAWARERGASHVAAAA